MNIYVSSRFNRKQDVRALYKELEAKGHTITRDWTAKPVMKPYDADPAMSAENAATAVIAVQEADAHIILADEDATGLYVELGAAIASQLQTGKPKIFAVGDHNARTMFYFHPAVKRVKSIQEAVEQLDK